MTLATCRRSSILSPSTRRQIKGPVVESKGGIIVCDTGYLRVTMGIGIFERNKGDLRVRCYHTIEAEKIQVFTINIGSKMQVFTHQLLHANFSQLTRILHDITGTEKELVQILTEDLAAGLVDPSKAQQLLQQEAGGNGAPKQRPAVVA